MIFFSEIQDPYYLLLTGITAYLTGGMATFLTVTHRFMIINTDPDYRSLRFTVFQIYLVVGRDALFFEYHRKTNVMFFLFR